MSKFCLIPSQVQKFKVALKDGTINPEKLATMTSDERNKFLSKIVGKDNALQTNALFESKLLLKNQKAGYLSWAKKVGGMTKETKRDLISRIERLDKVLNPEEEKAFLRDLAETKLGVGVTEQEAKVISDLSNKVKEARSLQKEDLTFSSEKERLAYGRAKIVLINHVNDLKEAASKKFSLNPVKAVSTLGSNAKSLRASMDNSAIFRQGWKTLWTSPGIWSKNALKTFKDIYRTFGGKQVADELNADIISRPTYDMMVKAKLAVGNIEEAFPGTVVSKVPGLRRFYKASENAYTGFVQKTRADVFDKYIQIAQKSGVDLTDKELKSIGSMVNSLTGRATLPGDFERAANAFNNVFFSPRKFVADINTFTHPITGAGGSKFVRKQASINLLKGVMGTAGVLAVANAVKPGSVETDPRSSDFGKIRVGNTRFDVTGGISPIVTLASRLITQSSKSSTTGKVTPINSGDFGALTGTDVVYNFFENKLSPIASVIRDLIRQEDFEGNKPTLAKEAENLFVPIGFSTYKELQDDPNAANTLLSMIAESLGISTNTYGKQQKDWNQKPTKAQEAFKTEVGEQKFKQANEEFNNQYNDWFNKVSTTDTYKNLSDDGKSTLITNSKSKIQDKVFKQYGFKYRQERKTSGQIEESRTVKSLEPK